MRNAVQRRLDSEYFAAYSRLDPIEVARLISSVVTAKQPKAPTRSVSTPARSTSSKLLPTEGSLNSRAPRLTFSLDILYVNLP